MSKPLICENARKCAALFSACLAAGCALPPSGAPQPQTVPSPPPSVASPVAPPATSPGAPAAVPEPMVVPNEPAASTQATIEARQVIDLIAYASRVAAMASEEQRRELVAASQEFNRSPAARSRVRLAVLLALPGTPVNDDGRAATLLEPLAAGATAAPLRQFAALLHGQVAERLREQKKGTQLKEQIDGLRAIERSLMERQRGRK